MAPRFSVITPVCDPPADALRAALRSVEEQTFVDWELCLVDDASTKPHVGQILDELEGDARVRIHRRQERGGIVAASNDALALASGELVVLLDHDDLLRRDALALMDEAVRANPDADYLYSDEDKIDADGRHSGPFLKPAWSPERLRTQMYTCHVSVLRRAVVDAVGGFRAGTDGSQDWDLVLRVTEAARRVVHVPEILYSWRTVPGSTAATGIAAKAYAYDAGTRALQDHCDRIGFEGEVTHDPDPDLSGVYHLSPRLRGEPLVSIIVPTAGSSRAVRGEATVLAVNCARSLVDRSTYQAWELVAVVDDGTPQACLDEVRAVVGERLRIVPFDRPFSFSAKVNVGAIHSSGEHLLLLNDDIEITTPDWIERLLMYSRLPDIGAVGARLLFGEGTIQHAGVACRDGCPGHIYRGYRSDHRGYGNNVLVANNYLAVTGACLMTRTQLFHDLGGLSPRFPASYNDVDYCLKVWQSGHRVAYDPDTVLLHFESSSREPSVATWELDALQARWGDRIVRDPFLPRDLNRRSVDFVPPIQLADGSLLVS